MNYLRMYCPKCKTMKPVKKVGSSYFCKDCNTMIKYYER